MVTRAAIIPGNGAGDVEMCNWYGWARDRLSSLSLRQVGGGGEAGEGSPGVGGVEAVLRNMPDPVTAREEVWIPYMREDLHCGEDTVIIGHSSGAIAAMRFAESYKVKGLILVSAYVTDLGDETERESGYFNRPWQWEKIKENSGFVIQFASTDDPFVPYSEQAEVHKGLNSELKKYNNMGHFMEFTFPDLIKVFKEKLKL